MSGEYGSDEFMEVDYYEDYDEPLQDRRATCRDLGRSCVPLSQCGETGKTQFQAII